MSRLWRALTPLVAGAALALLPAPDGLAPHAWWYFAVFAAVIVALILEPLPGGAIGLIGVTVITATAPWTLFGPAELGAAAFEPTVAALQWALSGFSNATVWLIFGAFMFALGYQKSGLGMRVALLLVRAMGRRTLTLGYAITLADVLLAPVTPSVTARSGGTIYPVVRNLPPLYGSEPNDPSRRRIGSYLMWVAIASTSVTSSLFLTALAPNLLAVELVGVTVGVEIGWIDWFSAFAPVGLLLLLVLPLLVYWLYPPEVKEGLEVQRWADGELNRAGSLSRREIVLSGLVVMALLLWIFAGAVIHATTAALLVVCLMMVLGVVSWEDILAHKSAWNTLAWFATLVALADGLVRVGFVAWFADAVAAQLITVAAGPAVLLLLLINFFGHYLFASVTAHVTAVLPVLLTVAATLPGVDLPTVALALCLQLGIMGIISPFASGASPVYYGSGYLPAGDYWRLGALFGVIYLGTFLFIGVPWMLMSR